MNLQNKIKFELEAKKIYNKQNKNDSSITNLDEYKVLLNKVVSCLDNGFDPNKTMDYLFKNSGVEESISDIIL